MSFFNAIAAFKGAFLGALLGNHLPRTEVGSAVPQGPVYGPPHSYRPYPSQPGYGHHQPARPTYGRPHHAHPHPVSDHQLPIRPLYPLFNR